MQDWQDLLKTMAAAASQIGDAAKSVEKSLKKTGADDETGEGQGRKKMLKGVVAAAGLTAAAAGIGYALYRYFAPKYLGGFPDDDFKDDFDDYFEDEDGDSSRTEKDGSAEAAAAGTAEEVKKVSDETEEAPEASSDEKSDEKSEITGENI